MELGANTETKETSNSSKCKWLDAVIFSDSKRVADDFKAPVFVLNLDCN